MAACLLGVTLLSGCTFDTLDVDRRSLVDVITIDTDGAGGYAVTYGFSDLQGGGASSGGGGAGTSLNGLTYVTRSAPTGSQALAQVENTLTAAAFYGAVRLVILGEDAIAKGAGEALLATSRLREIPQDALVAAVRGRASSFVTIPSVSARKPLYFAMKSKSLVDGAISGERLFAMASNATTTDLAVMLPMFAEDQGLARFAGASILAGGRQRAFLPDRAARLVHPLVSTAPETISVPVPQLAPNPLMFRARRTYADVTTLADGSVRINWHGDGRLDEMETLSAQGHSDQMIETALAKAIMEDLTGAIGALLQAGVDPRQIAGRPTPEVAQRVHVIVNVHLDHGITGP